MKINLNGKWDWGLNRTYSAQAEVPGLVTDPKLFSESPVWYKREISLPGGEWEQCTLVLNGARFCPKVYVNGDEVSYAEGGMTVTEHLLKHPEVTPGASIVLEIVLQPLDKIAVGDASRPSKADWWRSNISSLLWDSVSLRFHGEGRITRVLPSADMEADAVTLRWTVDCPQVDNYQLHAQLLGEKDNVLSQTCIPVSAGNGMLHLPLHGALPCWSPENPHLAKLHVSLLQDDRKIDTIEMNYGHRNFEVVGKSFRLNGNPFTLRAGTVVWHRWCRDPEARELAFDVEWFEENIVKRLKSHGANTLRFHLGMPPEEFLDLCDSHGLAVQAEWGFFHAMEGSPESLVEQWRNWLDLCLRHPSVCLIHPWNETEGKELETAFTAIETLAPEYPDLVISHRDVLHLHKYWWSLFSNVGILYDSADEFQKAIMVDEFGGNYLDGEGNIGGYETLRSAFERFLGHNNTREKRLELQSLANNRIAEYWRRIGAAGFSPFCALGSPEDGNHHFMGALQDGNPKRVWQDLTAAYAPRSCSLDVWDRNYLPHTTVSIPLHLFNETGETSDMAVQIGWRNESGEIANELTTTHAVSAYEHAIKTITLSVPKETGQYHLQATLTSGSPGVTQPIVSSWPVQVFLPQNNLSETVVGVPPQEEELVTFLHNQGIKTCGMDDASADVIVTGRQSWTAGIEGVLPMIDQAIDRKTPVLMLDIGPQERQQHEQNQAAESLIAGAVFDYPLCKEISVRFKELAEPESCIHPTESGNSLWNNLSLESTRLWNGLRGGLIAPAWELEPMGLQQEALLSQWQERGADPESMRTGHCIAYELAGHYQFSETVDSAVEKKLRKQVQFLVEDAPALAGDIDPNAPILCHDLGQMYKHSDGQAEELRPLVLAGRSLCRTPVSLVSFSQNQGHLLLSQLLTTGRLAEGFGREGAYGLRVDPAAQQMVLNLIQFALDN